MVPPAATAKGTTSLKGLHLLLTYECNYACDHCFTWGSPSQRGTMGLDTVLHILDQALILGTVEWIYFEGGEAFLYYETMLAGVLAARERGFRVGIVTNAFWADNEQEAERWLQPLAGHVADLSVSSDDYHGSPDKVGNAEVARAVATRLGIPVDFISVAEPGADQARGTPGKLPPGVSAVMFRGRAAVLLASRVIGRPRESFDHCPWEELRHPERLHVDPYGNLHVCQGISVGNLSERSLVDIMAGYRPDRHPVVGPLLDGGPAELARRHGVPTASHYADHCHMCYEVRNALRERFPDELTPDQMYG